MNKFFDSDSLLIRFLNMFADLCYLALLWIVCCLPVVTVGASTSAYYSVAMKLIKGEESYIGRGFFAAFKKNFKVSTITWLIMGVIGGFMTVSIYIVWAAGQIGNKLFYAMPFYLMTLIIYLITYNFVFPYIAKFYDSATRSLYVSLFFGIKYFGYSLIIIIVDVGILALAFLKFPALFIAYPVASGFYHAHVYRHIFDKIISKMDVDKEENAEEV